MPQTTIGDLTQSQVFNQRNALLKDRIQSLSTEVTTGLTSTVTEQVRGDYSALTGIEASLAQLSSFKRLTSETATRASTMQLVLNSISDDAVALSSALLGAATSNSATRINAAGYDADQRLQAALSALNTQVGATALFSGQATDQPSVTDTDTMMSALSTAVSGALSAADVESAVNDWFADPAGFVAVVYKGGDVQQAVDIGPDETAKFDVTGKDPAIAATLKGLALASLLQRGVLSGDTTSRADLARRASARLTNAQAPLLEVTARLGTIEATITNAGIRNDAEKAALETARLGLLSVDPYEAATRLQESQTQLETLFAVTARMARLSLVNYL